MAGPASPKLPMRFILATFVGAAIVTGLILYFGLAGQLGAGVP